MSGESRTRMNTFHLCSLRYSDPRSSPSPPPPRYKSPFPSLRRASPRIRLALSSASLLLLREVLAGKPLLLRGVFFLVSALISCGEFFLAACVVAFLMLIVFVFHGRRDGRGQVPSGDARARRRRRPRLPHDPRETAEAL